MSIQLQRFQVENLFNKLTLDVPIIDNTLILVGENGTGKSTLINLIYFTLTSQWDRLADLPFHSCTITIDGEDYKIFRDNLPKPKLDSVKASSVLSYFKRKVEKKQLEELLYKIAEHSSEYWDAPEGKDKLRILNNEYNLAVKSATLTRKISFAAFVDLASLNPMYDLINQEDTEELGARSLSKKLKLNNDEQILFLPTYRRIEKELSDVFPNLNLDEMSSPFNSQDYDIGRDSGYIELVEFGMTDVVKAFNSTLKKLDQNFRSELNRLTGSYLHDILQGRYNDVDVSSLITDEAAGTVELMLSRIDEEILSKDDRNELRNLLSLAKGKGRNDLDVKEKISAHFLNSLLRIHKSQQQRENPVRRLVEFVNEYLNNKQLEFNPGAFELMIKRRDSQSSDEVPLHSLSSGEKQIVSLFCHIFLSGHDKHFIVIDEPELSISVMWQRRFLQDLKDTGKCSGLIAVTHSPFVFENSLTNYAHSISEFIREEN